MATIRAAIRSYDAWGTVDDNELLRLTMAPFVVSVREQLLMIRSRRGVPRWS
jgi:hypothetical protein